MDKRFWAIIGVLILVFGGILFVNNKNTASDSGAVSATEHLRGNLDSDVTLVEYGDFQCSACAVFSTTVDEVYAKYEAKVRFQFRHLPLASIHQNALAAARAAEAADIQGKFWEMHDLLYQNQDRAGQSGWVVSKEPLTEYFVGYAQQIKLDTDKFKTDFVSAKANDRINADKSAFAKTGAQEATPAFFINGEQIQNSELTGSDGLPSVEAFSKVIDQALADSK